MKELVKNLQQAGRAEATEAQQIFRPWGNYERLDMEAGYQVKRITVKPGGVLSLQKHRHRAEHWVVVQGEAEVTIDGKVTTLMPNQSVYVPLGSVHRLANRWRRSGRADRSPDRGLSGRGRYHPARRSRTTAIELTAQARATDCIEQMARLYDSRKRILVTGGAGFLGSHLIDRLLAQGHEVLCIDNLFTGTKRNVDHLHNHPRFEFLRHDVCFPLYVEVDEIYNLACPASPVHYQHDPVQTTKTSVHGAINMLGLAKRLKCKIFQASTSEVYGDPAVHPQTEDYWGNVNPIGPRSCYDEGKRCAETLFFDYRRQHGLEIKVARIFNTYGPRMHPRDGRVVSNFIMQALAGEDITIYGDGTQTRSFCYVDDLIEGFLRLMDTDSDVYRSGQSRQPGRIHDDRACRKHPEADRLGFEAGAPAAAGR